MSSVTTIEPVRRSRLSQQIVIQLCQLIRETPVQPGGRLPPERDLAEQLGVSRASLREALRTLEVAGLVESRHGGGTYVRDVFEHGLIPTLALALRATGDVVGDLWEVRGIVEPAIAARAAARATHEDLAAIEAILAEQADALEHEERLLALDRQFHAALARASGNAVAVRVIELINGLLEAGKVHFMTSQARRHRAYDRHREIMAAIVAGQPQVARDAMLRHLQEVEEHILGGLAAEDEARRAAG